MDPVIREQRLRLPNGEIVPIRVKVLSERGAAGVEQRRAERPAAQRKPSPAVKVDEPKPGS